MCHNTSPYQQELADRCVDEESFEFVDYPNDADDDAALASQQVPGADINLKKKSCLKSLKESSFVSLKSSSQYMQYSI